MKFGEVLKEIRKENGDSLRRLAEKIDVVFTYIDKIEKGESPISKNMYEKFIKIYPLYKQKLTRAYLEEVLPESIQKELNLKIEKSFSNDMKILIDALDKESQKIAFLLIVERLEYTALKKGNYDKIKHILEEIKSKVENL